MDHLLSFIYRSLLLNFGVFCSVVAPVTAQLVSSKRNSTFNRSAQNADTGQQHKVCVWYCGNCCGYGLKKVVL
jgi:hypothetical protein